MKEIESGRPRLQMPERRELENLSEFLNYSELSSHYNVSESTIRRWLIRLKEEQKKEH